MVKKSPNAYRTIGEASKEIGVPTYVLRFWETKFKQVKLIKRPGGRRFYKPEDIKLLLKIKNFLKNDGLSIKQANEKIDADINNAKSNIDTNTNREYKEKPNFKNIRQIIANANTDDYEELFMEMMNKFIQKYNDIKKIDEYNFVNFKKDAYWLFSYFYKMNFVEEDIDTID